jgi:hypothetical protein
MTIPEAYKQALWIAGFGAVGGILSCVYSAVTGSPLEPWFPKGLASMALGAGASFVGAYVLATPDMSQPLGRIRGLAFALICGFAWRPVYDAGGALVEQAVKNRNDSPILAQAKASEEQATELTQAPPAELPARISATKASALALIGDMQRAQGTETKRKVRRTAEKLIQSLAGPASTGDPKVEDAQLDALKELGKKAADEKDMELFQATVHRIAAHPWSPEKRQAASVAAKMLTEQVNPPGVNAQPTPPAPPR